MSFVSTVAFVVAAAVAMLWWIPQCVRVLSAGDAGVSPVTWASYAASGSVWVVWAVSSAEWGIVVVNTVEAIGVLSVVAILRAWRQLVILGVFIGSAFAVAAAVSPTAVAIAGLFVTTGCRVPQIVAAVREPIITGISWRSWMISALGNGAWVVWAAIEGVWWFFATTIAAVTMSIAVAIIVSVRQRTTEPQDATCVH
jgi:hypothetical protein